MVDTSVKLDANGFNSGIKWSIVATSGAKWWKDLHPNSSEEEESARRARLCEEIGLAKSLPSKFSFLSSRKSSTRQSRFEKFRDACELLEAEDLNGESATSSLSFPSISSAYSSAHCSGRCCSHEGTGVHGRSKAASKHEHRTGAWQNDSMKTAIETGVSVEQLVMQREYMEYKQASIQARNHELRQSGKSKLVGGQSGMSMEGHDGHGVHDEHEGSGEFPARDPWPSQLGVGRVLSDYGRCPLYTPPTNKELRSQPMVGGARAQKEEPGRATPCVEGRLSQRASDPQSTCGPKEARGGDLAGGKARVANRVATIASGKRGQLRHRAAERSPVTTGNSEFPSQAPQVPTGPGGGMLPPNPSPLLTTNSSFAPSSSTRSTAVSTSAGAIASTSCVSCIEKPEDIEVQEETKKKKNNEGRRRRWKARKIMEKTGVSTVRASSDTTVMAPASVRALSNTAESPLPRASCDTGRALPRASSDTGREEILNFGDDLCGMSYIKPLRSLGDLRHHQKDDSDVGMDNGSIQPWLVDADDDSLSDTINKQEGRRTRTLSKPDLQLENRGPKITEAALQIFGKGISATAATKEKKSVSFADEHFQLNPFIEMVQEGLNAVNPSEWVQVEVIADSGACETVMPKFLCNNIKIRESMGSKSGVEYEVASGVAVKNLGERHCEVFCEGAASPMMMHFQVADIHRPLLSLSRAADQGFRSHLGANGGWLEDSKTGECIPIQRRGNLYIMHMWVRAGPDERPPDPQASFAGRG